jgi:hypothetical protein
MRHYHLGPRATSRSTITGTCGPALIVSTVLSMVWSMRGTLV